jgi:hypothetical protein
MMASADNASQLLLKASSKLAFLPLRTLEPISLVSSSSHMCVWQMHERGVGLVAVKSPPTEGGSQDAGGDVGDPQAELLREVRAAAHMRTPANQLPPSLCVAIAPAFDSHATSSVIFPWIYDAVDLYTWRVQQGNLPEPPTVFIGAILPQLLDALEYCHARNVVHGTNCCLEPSKTRRLSSNPAKPCQTISTCANLAT